MTRAASLAARVQERIGVEPVVEPGRTGQFDVFAGETLIASRGGNPLTRILFGAGFPELDGVVDELEKRQRQAS